MSRKKRILMNNEASFLATGYATYGREVLTRLATSGKYEVAELASYGDVDDPRMRNSPWKYYGNLPLNEVENKSYHSKPTHQFGEFRFDNVCIDFKPDIVFSIRDTWMDEHIERSSARPYFSWYYMPTVDSEPQDEGWLSTYFNADGVCTYSKYGEKLLKQQTHGAVCFKGWAPPCANTTQFKLQDRNKLRASVGLPPNINIVGTVMRNQRRKLYPDLCVAFREFLDTAPDFLANNTYLYLHVAYPDVGWDIPKLIKTAGISHRVLLTYMCKSCKSVYASHFSDAKTICIHCGENTAVMPNVKDGVPPEILGNIIGLFDVYVQYATAEGFGVPCVEAASCGIPLMVVDYSAMEDFKETLGAIPIKVERKFCESSESCVWRALPDNQDFIKKLTEFLRKPSVLREKQGTKTKQLCDKNYSWEATTAVWEKCFEEAPYAEYWNSPANFHRCKLPDDSTKRLTNGDFVKWVLTHTAGRPDLINSSIYLRLLRDLNMGTVIDGNPGLTSSQDLAINNGVSYGEFTREMLVKYMEGACNYRNNFEAKRIECNKI